MVAIFTPALLDEIGEAVAGLRPSSCAIQGSTARDAQGVPTGASWTTSATVGCRVEPAGRRAVEATFGPLEQSDADAIVYVPRGTEVTARHRIVATIEDVETTLNVISVGLGSHLAEIPVLCVRGS